MTKSRKSKIRNSNLSDKKVPYIIPDTDKGQAVGCVVNAVGNGRFVVTALCDKRLLSINCSVPGKFKGRNKRRNRITTGLYVLITAEIRFSKDGSKQMGEIVHIYPKQHEKLLLMDQFIVNGMDDRGNVQKTVDIADSVVFEDEDAITFDDI